MQDDGEPLLVDEADQRAFAATLSRCRRPARLLVQHDIDVDSIAAAALVLRVAQRTGLDAVACSSVAAARPAVRAHPEVVLACGAQRGPAADLHLSPAHAAAAPAWQKSLGRSFWTWELCHAQIDMQPWDWLGALGCLEAPLPWLRRVRNRYTRRHLQWVWELVTAAGRASHPDVPAALQLLSAYANPRALARAAHDAAVRPLAERRDEVRAACAAGEAATPALAGRLAVIRLFTPCRIEGHIARLWAARLPRQVVLVANLGRGAQVMWASCTQLPLQAMDFLRTLGWPADRGTSVGVEPDAWYAFLRRQHVGVT